MAVLSPFEILVAAPRRKLSQKGEEKPSATAGLFAL
jgi:hypothetical protein